MRLAFILLVFTVFAVPGQAQDVYKIGVLGNTSSTMSQAAFNAAELLAESHNNTYNSYRAQVVFFNEDDGSVKGQISRETVDDVDALGQSEKDDEIEQKVLVRINRWEEEQGPHGRHEGDEHVANRPTHSGPFFPKDRPA